MIGYATLGASDLDKALAFYDGLLGAFGGKRVMTLPDARGITVYGASPGSPMLAITRPYDGAPASPGNGAMVALAMDSRAQVDRAYAKAMELGARDEGGPGERGGGQLPQAFYGAYFRDLDGNKLCVFKIGEA